jgi:hypothetical protein
MMLLLWNGNWTYYGDDLKIIQEGGREGYREEEYSVLSTNEQ